MIIIFFIYATELYIQKVRAGMCMSFVMIIIKNLKNSCYLHDDYNDTTAKCVYKRKLNVNVCPPPPPGNP